LSGGVESADVTEQRTGPRVAVVGGGIIGLSIAWRLARGGAQVELFERGALAGEASRVAAGMLAPVSEADPAESILLELGLASVAQWPVFAAELEDDAEAPRGSLLDPTGTLLVARDADEGRWLEREAAIRRDQHLDCTMLTPREARRLEPDLAPGLRGALHVPGDHAVDPRAVAVSLEVAARGAGAQLHDHAQPITGLDDSRLAGFDRVVVASGAWPLEGGAAVAATHPVKGQLLILRDPEHARREEPIMRHVVRAQTVYCVPRGDGRYVVGATMEHRGEDRTVTAWAVHDLLRELFEVVPAAREFVLEEALAGLRPATASGDPLIGPAPEDPAGPDARVLYAVGHYRGGVLFAPATAQRIAALVLG
jgi:glycine oxidase